MNIPADIPSSDQENIYYSIKSLLSELENYFTKPSLDKIESFAKELYLPVFVFDDSNAPNSFQIDVYPRGSSKFNILLDSSGAILDNNSTIDPVIPITPDDNLIDGASKITLDVSFHSESRIKSSDFFTDLEEDDESLGGMELLLATKFWMDENVNNTLKQRNQYMEMIKSIVTNTFSSLPPEEISIIGEEYKKREAEIDSVKKVVQDIKEGQKSSLDTLKFSNVSKSIYPSVVLNAADLTTLKDLKLTGINIAQSLSQLNNSRGVDQYYKEGTSINQLQPNTQQTEPAVDKESQHVTDYVLVWNNFVGSIIESNLLEDPTIETMVSGPLSQTGEDIDSVLNFSYNNGAKKNTFLDEGQEESWLNEWYFNNFGKLLGGLSRDFDGLDSFLENYTSVLQRVQKVAELNSTGGSFLLVHQAILKSILKLCQSNIDISEFSPRDESNDIFASMGRSSILGPSGCHQAPSRHSMPEDNYSISNFSKTGFLCYQALISIISKVSANQDSRQFLIDNVKTLDSDHDKVIELWKNLSDGDELSKDSKPGLAYHADPPIHQNKLVSHGFSINEEFESKEIFLIPAGDKHVGKSSRTFIGFNIPCVSSIKESEFIGTFMGHSQLEGIKALSTDNNSAVDSDGMVSSVSQTDSYELMGYKTTLQAFLVGNDAPPSATQSYSRNSRVHYGYTNDDNWDGEEIDNNVFDFFKQKNYNFPYFWASMTGIYRALSVEVYRELADSINDIMGSNMELSIDDCTTMFDNGLLWDAIDNTVSILANDISEVKSDAFVNVDGTISLTDSVSTENSNARRNKFSYRNTSGDNTVKLIKDFCKFASLISGSSSVKLVEEKEPIAFDYNSFIPLEGLFNSANPNFSNSHGGFGSYIAEEFEDIYDVLEFRKFEFEEGITKKSSTAFGLEESFSIFYTSFVEGSSYFLRHLHFNQAIIGSFNNFKKFINGFVIPEDISQVFVAGEIDIKKDIKNPERIIKQIESNKALYSADASGLGNRWKNILIPDLDRFQNITKDWLYLYVLGIKPNSFSEDNVTVVASYIGSSGTEIEIAGTERSFTNLMNPSDFDMESSNTAERDSNLLINYLHLLKGIDISETSFSYKSKRVYEEHIIELESGVLPWTKDDFAEGEPKDKIDPIFNMSPWIYPTNYFYDVCISNEFKRVVGCVIKSSDLVGLDIDSLSIDSLNDIIGSIRWKIKES